MDKNKCPNFENKNTLTDKIFCLDNFFLSSQIKPFILSFITKKNLKIKSVVTLMETLGDQNEGKKGKKGQSDFYCEMCDFKCCKKYSWVRHLTTSKHQRMTEDDKLGAFEGEKGQNILFTCENCNKEYKHRQGLWKHKKICGLIKNEPSDKDLIMMLIKENSEFKNMMMKVLENGTTNHSHNTTTNSHNKAFNLNLFLNETCKNAMNITDFVDSIKLQLSDFMSMGEVGFVEGISNIIVQNLNSLDETVRPIHCTDQKRETFYVKDQNIWEKEDDEKKKIKNMIKSISYKNEKLMKTYKETYPDYNNSDSKRSDQYSKIMIEAMDCKDESREKIIKNISKTTTISKST